MNFISYAFLDRDGTLLVEPPDYQIDSMNKFALVPGVISGLKKLQKSGFRLIMVTNQDGLGSNSYSQASFDLIQELFLKILSSEGIFFEAILVCPHRAEEQCRCRKPKVGLVQKYIRSQEMDRKRSFVLGDRDTDLELAENMGIQGKKIFSNQDWSSFVEEILSKPRIAQVQRKTKETEIWLSVNLDSGTEKKSSSKEFQIHTGHGFFDHMLEQLSYRGGFNLQVEAKGDLKVDDHHLVEDVAIALGMALREALGDKRGIHRYGFVTPMDESLSQVALDLSGRSSFHMNARFPREFVGELSTEMVSHFFRSLSESLGMSLHIQTTGENAHHMVEATFKGVGNALRQALIRNLEEDIPSTKGIL